jgi:HAD superfamily hydrolase (TIGR01509 family)
MGKGKRDPSQFTDVAADLGLPPAAILFVDDSEMNVARAESVGMQAIQFSSRESFIESLKARLAD